MVSLLGERLKLVVICSHSLWNFVILGKITTILDYFYIFYFTKSSFCPWMFVYDKDNWRKFSIKCNTLIFLQLTYCLYLSYIYRTWHHNFSWSQKYVYNVSIKLCVNTSYGWTSRFLNLFPSFDWYNLKRFTLQFLSIAVPKSCFYIFSK